MIKSTREAERNKKYLRSISLKSNKHWVNMRFESIKLYYTIHRYTSTNHAHK